MATLDFITSNPAIDAFQKGEKFRQEGDLNELKMNTGLQELGEKQITLPTRLRQLEATTATTENDLGEKKTTFPTRQRALEAGTSSAETSARVAKAEEPYAAPMKAAGLRSANSNALNSEMTGFYKSLELANAGDIEGARAVGDAIGHPVPESVLTNAETRAAVTAAAKKAQEVYPNRPKDQQTFIAAYLADMKQRREGGGRANDPTAPYAVPGAPEPQETSDFKSRFEMVPASRVNPDTGLPEQGYIHHDRTSGDRTFESGQTLTGKPGGGAGGSARKITGTEAIIGELRKENPSLSYSDALAIAKRTGQSTDMITLRREAIAQKSANDAVKADLTGGTKYDAQLQKYRRQQGLPDAPGATPGPQSNIVQPNDRIVGIETTPAPNPSPQRPGMMSPGNGAKPLDIQAPPLPPNLPQGVQYSWSPARQQFRDELGRVYDKNGTPVS